MPVISLRAGSLGEREPARIPMMIACVQPDFLMGKGEKSVCESGNNTCLVPRRYVLFYGLRGLCVGGVDQFDRFRCEAPGRIRFNFWSGLRFLERTQ